MPIKKSNLAKYPANWPKIRAEILERAGNKCERCGVPNHVIVDKKERFVVSNHDALAAGIFSPDKMTFAQASILRRLHWTRIVLTVAHLDHDVANNDAANLQALCQRCHNRHDIAHRKETREATKAAEMHRKLSRNWAGWQLSMDLVDQEGADDTANK